MCSQSKMKNDSIYERILAIPVGYSRVKYKNSKYGISRKDFTFGKAIKIYAEELGGTNIISFNYYYTQKKNYLKPCEMSQEKVKDFLFGFEKVKLTNHK